MAKKVWKTEKFLNSWKFKGHNSYKNESCTGTVTLYYTAINQVSKQ
jgi:hypothetical protein